eukprot:TRINITY_DN18885_c0_g2_i1.p1 TRINITY_DN18885_c0_g2~~TRINITY_DN18885_c0_g2_i1.p1  ORF type:complete len:222 (+),score=68.10 TRINITY_DN18885_c0_g2_i1:96-668(+)
MPGRRAVGGGGPAAVVQTSPHTSPLFPKTNVDVIDTNPQTQWVHGYGFWALYLFVIALVRVMAYCAVQDPALGWTMTVVAHGAVSYILLHWLKGSVIGDISSRGRYDHLTFWEQIDGEHHGTPIRRYFVLVPVTLLVLSLNWVRGNWELLPWVFGASALSLIPKLPFLHRSRLGGSDEPPLSPTSGGPQY